jgi:hypothetical protein
MDSELHFDRGGQSAHDIERATAALWADLAFDDYARSALKRDGLVLDGLRLTGPSPFAVHEIPNDNEHFSVSVAAADAGQREALLALWQVHFLKRLREAA